MPLVQIPLTSESGEILRSEDGTELVTYAQVPPVGCVINGRASGPTINGRACGCDGMKIHKAERFEVGDTWKITGLLTYADGSPFNLGAGCSIEWALQNSAGNTVLTLSLGSGVTVVDPDNGVCLITVTPLQSTAISVGSFVDQLRAVDPASQVSTQWQGPIDVYASFF